MFDVRPVDQTGDLDWDKIQSITHRDTGIKEYNEPKKSQLEKPVKAYILGVGIENENAPIFHDPNFNLSEILEYEVAVDQKELFLEA